MKRKGLIEEGEKEFKEITGRLRKRDFSGNEGQAIKNSSFQLATTLVAKIGSLLFTIIIARMLMPELFGLYSLALGTIVLFAGFSDFGVGTAMLTFVSKALGRGDRKKAKAYFSYLLKRKWILVGIVTLVLLGSAYFIANNYYDKPIFYALLVGGLYLPLASMTGFFEGTFRAANKFKFVLFKELIFQFVRMSLVPLAIFFFLRKGLEAPVLLGGIIFVLSLCFFVAFVFSYFVYRKRVKFSKEKKSRLLLEEKASLKKFIWPITLTVLSGVFFGYIDTIMLGHFVTGEFIGYYAAAFSLVASVAAIIGFTSGALFPIFARLKGKKLESGFRKTRLITLLISLAAAIVTFVLAKYLVLIAYGGDYLLAVLILQIFSLFILLGPIIGLYDAYFTSQERTKVIAFLLIITTMINIGLNWLFITQGLKIGMYEALIGAAIATLISKGVYLVGLGFWKRFRG